MKRRWYLAAIVATWSAVASAQPMRPLVIAQGTDAVTMDPDNTTQMTAMQPFNFVYEKLLNRDDAMKLVPELATAWSAVNDTTWAVQLRRGVKFHDGEDFNADAVKFTLDRVRVPGATAVSGGFTTIAEVKIVDPYTVHIITKQPDPLLPGRLAQWGSQILPPKYVAEAGPEGLAKKAIGTGPYRFATWRKDDQLVFEPNPDYRGEKPKFSRIVFRPIPDEFARMSALSTGEVDIAVNVPVDFTDRVNNKSTTYLAQTPAAATDVFLMGSDEPLKNADVRLALNIAIDRKKLSDTLFRGFAWPIAQGAAPTDFGYNPEIPDYKYDPAEARRLLAKAGYPNGFPIVVQSSNGYILGDTLVIEAVAEMLKQVGVQAQPRVLEIARRAEMLAKHQVTGLVLANPGSTTFDADGIVWRLLRPDALAGSYWPRGQEGTDFFMLMETARYTMDPNVRRDLYYKAAQVLHDDPPWLYLWQEFFLYGVGCQLAFKARVDTMILPTSVSVDPAKKGGGSCH